MAADDTLGRLRELNFGQLLSLDVQEPRQYSYNDYAKNAFIHPLKDQGYCTLCRPEVAAAGGAVSYLRNMSHGAHSADFVAALSPSLDTTAWRPDGVMFVFAAPSTWQNDLYRKEDKNTADWPPEKKRQPQKWYWVWGDDPRQAEDYVASSGLTHLRTDSDKYNALLFSAICMFKLANAYATNLVKCATLRQGPDGERAEFPESCVAKCQTAFLLKEIGIVKPRVLFCFGGTVHRHLTQLLTSSEAPGTSVIVRLPHPARPFEPSLIRRAYFWGILEGLCRGKVLTEDEYLEYARSFLNDIGRAPADDFVRAAG